jgi:hypothetical protein
VSGQLQVPAALPPGKEGLHPKLAFQYKATTNTIKGMGKGKGNTYLLTYLLTY